MEFIYEKKVFRIDREVYATICDFFESYSFYRINEIFIIPKSIKNRRSQINRMRVETNHLRYPVNVKINERGNLREYYIRSFGSDFNLVLFEWYETWDKPFRVYSLGKGLYNNREVALLALAQAFGEKEKLIVLADELKKKGENLFSELEITISTEFHSSCLRIAGVVQDEY